MIDFVEEIRINLEKAQEEEVLSTMVMILEFYLSKYHRDLGTTMTLIRKGLKEYQRLLEEEK